MISFEEDEEEEDEDSDLFEKSDEDEDVSKVCSACTNEYDCIDFNKNMP